MAKSFLGKRFLSEDRQNRDTDQDVRGCFELGPFDCDREESVRLCLPAWIGTAAVNALVHSQSERSPEFFRYCGED